MRTLSNGLRICMTALAVAFALVSCEKEPVYTPATINGPWVINAYTNGSEWTDMDITSVLYFNGSGSYTIKRLSDNSANTAFSNGHLFAPEELFSVEDARQYTVTVSGTKYRFESISGDFELVSESAGEMVFDYIGNSVVKGYKFSRVESFESSSGPDPGPGPDPGKESINGTKLVDGNDLVGLVYDSATGKGIAGVVVTDGYDCVKTDANGVYQFKSNSLSRLVYISTPAEYKIPVGSLPSHPLFYVEVKPDGYSVLRNDFRLSPLPEGKETKWTFIGIGDPQCATSSNASRYTNETIPDIKKAVANEKSVYAMTLGDIVFDSTNMWPSMKSSMSAVYNGAWYIPFFQTIGNHDHDSLKPDTTDDVMDDYVATSTFNSVFGPTDYSFNRGDVHVVSMDDIIVNSQKTSSKSNGKTWSYNGGFTAKQIEWLTKDLELVDNKDQKMIFVCCHIQFRNSSANNYQKVLTLMQQFKEAHLMIGHTHYTQNYIYTSRNGKGGLPIYEHIHGSACGAWWTSKCSSTVSGEPSGYTIYRINGAHIDDWTFKGTNRNADFQLRVFDGNDIYHQEKYPLNWYTASQKIGTYDFVVKGNAALKDCFVVEVFNDDDSNWTVELCKKSTGAKIGAFKRLANATCSNIAMSSHYYNVKGKTSDSYRSWTASHYWYYKPASGNPSGESDWEVVVTHKLPGNTASHVYTCSTITRESDFEKEFYF